MGEIKTGPPRGAVGIVDGRKIVVHQRVKIEREPVAEAGKAVVEVECAKARAGIIGAELYRCSRRSQAEEPLQKRMEVDRLVIFAAPDDGALEAEFQVLCGAEADLLHMDPGVDGIDVAAKRTDQKLIAKRAGEAGEPRNVQRLDAVDVEGIDVLGVVGVGKGATLCRPKPLVLFAERNYVIEHLCRYVGLHHSSLRNGGDRSDRNGGLVVQRNRGVGRSY